MTKADAYVIDNFGELLLDVLLHVGPQAGALKHGQAVNHTRTQFHHQFFGGTVLTFEISL